MMTVWNSRRPVLRAPAVPTYQPVLRARGFKSPGQAERFLPVFSVIVSFFRPGRHLLTAVNYREIMRRFNQWHELAGLQSTI